MKSVRFYLTVIWFGVLVLALALAIYVKIAYRNQATPIGTAHEVPAQVLGEPTEPYSGSRTVIVSLPDWNKGQLTLRNVTFPLSPGDVPLNTAIAILVRRTPQFPQGTKLLGASLENGVAKIDFNEAIQSGMSSDDEAAILRSLRKTAGQFSNVERIRILVNGKPIDSLGGHSDEAGQMMPVER
ncbi:MAG: GerMN domain-containing protein [bacterium]|jgi:spore germination protein GerM